MSPLCEGGENEEEEEEKRANLAVTDSFFLHFLFTLSFFWVGCVRVRTPPRPQKRSRDCVWHSSLASLLHSLPRSLLAWLFPPLHVRLHVGSRDLLRINRILLGPTAARDPSKNHHKERWIGVLFWPQFRASVRGIKKIF